MKRNRIGLWVGIAFFLASAVACLGQAPPANSPSGTVFLGTGISPSAFDIGAGLFEPIGHTFAFEPTIALAPHVTGVHLFTLDGSLLYNFHPDDEVVIPYVLAGVGYARFGGTNNATGFIGAGGRIAMGHRFWLIPEIRGGFHRSSRFTIGLSKSF